MLTRKNEMFYKNIIDNVGELFLRYRGVRTFRYEGRSLFNAQNNNLPIQVFCDNVSYSRLNRTEGEFIVELNITILQQPSKEEGILEVQDKCYTLACNVIAGLDRFYSNVMQVWDYSIVTLANYTDDDASGVRVTLDLRVANPADLCYEFDEFPYSGDTEPTLDVSGTTVWRIDVNPITLPKTPKKC